MNLNVVRAPPWHASGHIRRQGRIGAAIFLSALLNFLVIDAAPAATPVIETTKGPVQGFYSREVVQFRGIPYAAPPVGSRRWMPPAESAGWTAVRAATTFAPACPQITTLGVFAGPTKTSEDCLYLNVFAPRNAPGAAAGLPVIVWLHGGGHVAGASEDYDGSLLAAGGPTVVVTLNYRLNLLGFFAHPALDAEGHLFANYGILDQQAALRWVRDNIARFGGDPSNVTLAGQSAGGSDAGSNLTSPFARGLFHRAIIQSSASYLSPTLLQAAQAKGVGFAAAAGCGRGADAAVAACLRNLPVAEITRLSGTPKGNGPFVVSSVLDGQIIPTGVTDAFAAGRFSRVPVMNGSAENEGGFYAAVYEYFTGPPPRTLTDADVETFAASEYGTRAPEILRRYAVGVYETPQRRLAAMRTDSAACRIWQANHLLADKVPLYAYEFRDKTAPSYFPKMPGLVMGAYHTSELQYLFPRWRGGRQGIPRDLSPRQRRLSNQLVQAWTNFARTGNPNGRGNAPWPAYGRTPGAGVYLALDVDRLSTFDDAEFKARHNCDFW